MDPLPTEDLRSNKGTWAVPAEIMPALTKYLVVVLPPEPYDPTFVGQKLETSYFDTLHLNLRKARLKGERYLTLRLRCYQAAGKEDAYALSAKTEGEKFRVEVAPEQADAIKASPQLCIGFLPANLQARLVEIADTEELTTAVCVYCKRYAVENRDDRFTLDVGVRTDIGKHLHTGVLEYKATAKGGGLHVPPFLHPMKLSKFLWATEL